jgi:uncharacterized protein YcbK (DUF882 family)
MQLTKNFHSEEFRCKDGTPVPKKYEHNLIRLATNLQRLRDYLGAPVKITGSGYRTPTHNSKVGGAKASLHLTASASDINVTGFTPEQVHEAIEYLIGQGKMDEGGLGLYKTFVHYDVRGYRARWKG